MSAETKTRVLIYKRADFLTDESRTLQTVLEDALKACKKTGERVITSEDGDQEVRRVLNEHRKIGNALGGVLYRYTPGHHQVVMAPNADALEWPVAQVLPPTLSDKQKSEFVDGLLFFLIFENHLIISQSAAFRIRQLEDYLCQFLRDKAGVTNSNEMVILKDVPSEKLRKEGLTRVRAVRFDLPLKTVGRPRVDASHDATTVRRVIHRHGVSLVESTLKAFGLDLPKQGLTENDADSVELRIELRVGGRRVEESNELLDQVGNLFAGLPDRDFEVELDDGAKLKGADLVIRTTARIETNGGIPKTNSVWKEMARYLKELQESKTVVG